MADPAQDPPPADLVGRERDDVDPPPPPHIQQDPPANVVAGGAAGAGGAGGAGVPHAGARERAEVRDYNGDVRMHDGGEYFTAVRKKGNLPSPQPMNKRIFINEETAKQLKVALAVFIENVCADFRDTLTVHGYEISDVQATAWIFVQLQPMPLVIMLREAVNALSPPVIPSIEWLVDKLKEFVSATDGAAVFLGIRRMKSVKPVKTVDEAIQHVTDLRRELPPTTPDAFFIYHVIDLLPETLQDRFMWDRSGDGKVEWTKWAPFQKVLKTYAQEIKSHAAAQAAKGGAAGGSSGSGVKSSSGGQVARPRPTLGGGGSPAKKPRGNGNDMPGRIPVADRLRRPVDRFSKIWVRGLDGKAVEKLKLHKQCLLCLKKGHMAVECSTADAKFAAGDFFFYNEK